MTMGRKRKVPDKRYGIIPAQQSKQPWEEVEERIGLRDKICQDCNARHDPDIDRCRKCGSKNFRRKRQEFADE